MFAKALVRFVGCFAICSLVSLMVAFVDLRAKAAWDISVEDDIMTLIAVGAVCLAGLAIMIFEARQQRLRARAQPKGSVL